MAAHLDARSVPTEDLIARYQRGQTAAFSALFSRYKDYVYRGLRLLQPRALGRRTPHPAHRPGERGLGLTGSKGRVQRTDPAFYAQLSDSPAPCQTHPRLEQVPVPQLQGRSVIRRQRHLVALHPKKGIHPL
jgi:hypothetical protein